MSYVSFVRRFTLASITMLGGIVVAPACGTIVGIDTDRELKGTEATGSSSGTTSGTATPGTNGDASAATDANASDGSPATGICENTIDGLCEIKCQTPGCGSATNRIDCPDGRDCILRCEKDNCEGITCAGGKSCIIDCTGGGGSACEEVSCQSPSCTFRCGQQGNNCSKAECSGANTACTQLCLNNGPGGPKLTEDCQKHIQCCGEGGRTCPKDADCRGK